MKTNTEQLLDIILEEVNVKQIRLCVFDCKTTDGKKIGVLYDGSWVIEYDGVQKPMSQKNAEKMRNVPISIV